MTCPQWHMVEEPTSEDCREALDGMFQAASAGVLSTLEDEAAADHAYALQLHKQEVQIDIESDIRDEAWSAGNRM